jgi:hypothetical protein
VGLQEKPEKEQADKKKEGGKKWYEEPLVPVGISIIAIIASFISSIIATNAAESSNSTKLQFDEQTRLTTLIQQLSDTRERIAELALQYGDRAPIPSVELRQPIVEEAVGLIKRTPASSFQKMVIAESLNETNQPDRAEPIAREAESQAQNLVDQVSAARVLAVAYFNQGKAVDGRRAYVRALRFVDITLTGVDPLIKTLYQLETEQFWISSELRINNCSGAKERLWDLEHHGEQFPKSLGGEAERRTQPTSALVVKICS